MPLLAVLVDDRAYSTVPVVMLKGWCARGMICRIFRIFQKCPGI